MSRPHRREFCNSRLNGQTRGIFQPSAVTDFLLRRIGQQSARNSFLRLGTRKLAPLNFPRTNAVRHGVLEITRATIPRRLSRGHVKATFTAAGREDRECTADQGIEKGSVRGDPQRLMAGISIRRRTVELQKVISPATSKRLAPAPSRPTPRTSFPSFLLFFFFSSPSSSSPSSSCVSSSSSSSSFPPRFYLLHFFPLNPSSLFLVLFFFFFHPAIHITGALE